MRLPRADFPALTVALWVLGIALISYLVALAIPRSEGNLFVDVVLRLAVQLGAVAVFVVVAIHGRFARRDVPLTGVAIVLTVLGYSLVGGIHSGSDRDGLANPSGLDVVYLLAYPLMLAAFWVMLRRYPLPHVRIGWAVALDAAVATLGAGALFAFVLGPSLPTLTEQPPIAVLFGAVYPALDLLLLAIIGAVAASSAINLGNRSLFFVFGLLAFATGDMVFALMMGADLGAIAALVNGCWAIGFACFAWWAAGQTRAAESGTRSPTAIPILGASVLTALAVLVYASQVQVPTAAVVLSAATLGLATVPVLLRQIEAKRLLSAQQDIVTQLEGVDRAKSEMLATVNHEIRTPLTSIRGYLELVINGEAGPIPAEAERMLRTVDHNADRLALLVDDMLTMSRLDSGTAIPEREPVDLLRLLYRVVASLQPFASSRDVSLDIDEFDVEATVIGDEVQLERAFTNIAQNAVKFTPNHGSVGIELEREGDNIVVRVIDTGIGIPESDMHLLFSRFFRASNAQSEAVPGTGLGLAIVRGLVRAHQGDITIASTVDVGTTVRVTLPVAP